MIILWNALAAIIVALALGLLLVALFNRTGPGPASGFLFFFIIIFLATWAVGVWFAPVGPVVGGVPWLTLLITAILVTLLIGAAIPPSPPAIMPDQAVAEASAITIGLFFYVLLAGFLALIIAGLIFGTAAAAG